MSLLSHSLSHINEVIVLFLALEISAVVMNWHMGRLCYISLLSHSLSHINEVIVLFLALEISAVVMNWYMGRLCYMSLLSHIWFFSLKYSQLMHHSWLMRTKHEVFCKLLSKVPFNTIAYISAMIKYSDIWLEFGLKRTLNIDGLVQERRNSIASSLESHLSCTNWLINIQNLWYYSWWSREAMSSNSQSFAASRDRRRHIFYSLSHINEVIVLFLALKISAVVMKWHMGRICYMSWVSHGELFFSKILLVDAPLLTHENKTWGLMWAHKQGTV